MGELQAHLMGRHKQIHQAYLQAGGVIENITTARKSTRKKHRDESANQKPEESEQDEDEEVEVDTVIAAEAQGGEKVYTGES